MKKYLRRAFECTALVIVLVMLAGSVAEFAGASIEAARSKLTSMMDMAESLYSDGVEDEQQLAISAAQSGVRATLIGLDGSVIYDSEASGTIENHAHREEFKKALEGKTGYAQRTSESVGSSMIYCARRIGDCVLRLSTLSQSAYAVLYDMLPIMIVLAVLLCMGTAIFASHFSAKFTQAIQALDDMLVSGRPLSVDCRIEKLQTDMNEVRRTERMRTDFVANASHELKSPLTSIKGFAELMSVGCVTDPEKQREYLNRIATESDRMLGVINDILYLSRLEDDTHAAEEVIDLGQMSREVKESLDQLASARNITIEQSGSGKMQGAPREIWTLIYNLVDNAIRYGVEGGWVKLHVADGLIEVSDNGIGIDEPSQSRVFERFYRVDPSRSRKSGGTGLGLSIVKHIVINNGGQITLKSEPGAGSTFTCLMKKAEG